MTQNESMEAESHQIQTAEDKEIGLYPESNECEVRGTGSPSDDQLQICCG